jgi:iron complex transport system substrate-binding protein
VNRLRILPTAIILLVAASFARTTLAVTVTDDLGHDITVQTPVRRIVSLAPNITELLFAAGAGDLVTGVVRYSNFPPEAKNITRVGDTHNLDIEEIVSLDPDLVIAWQSGNGPAIIKRLKDLGYRVYVSEPANIETIAKTIRDLGNLSGHSETAARVSSRFISELHGLEQQYAGRRPVTVFYQIWNQPLFTVNGKHVISEVIRLCGGHNIFHDLPTLSARVSMEAVLAADPEVIIASGADDKRPPWLQDWYHWPSLQAVKTNHIFFIPPDLIQRNTPRILQGARMMCKFIDAARKSTGSVSKNQ